MHRDDTTRLVLYIEPKNPKTEAIEDEYTKLLEDALVNAKKGTSNYSNTDPNALITFGQGNAFKGIHRCNCGEHSSNVDFLLENGMITNSLAPHYLRYHRDEIGANDWEKIKRLKQYYSL